MIKYTSVLRNSMFLASGLLGGASILLACSMPGSPGEGELSPQTGEGDTAVVTVELPSYLPTCNSTRRGSVYYVSSEEAFYYCNGSRYRVIEVTGKPGANGKTWLTALSAASATQCSSGGTVVSVGPDNDGDGFLDANEVSGTAAVCNGAQGPQGEQGEQGPQGEPGEKGPQGDTGEPGPEGAQGEQGDPGEDGTNGSNGTDGQNGLGALVATEPAALEICPHGGIAVSSGIDLDSDALLDPEEILDTDYVCNGAPGETGQDGDDGAPGSNGLTALVTQTPEPAGEHCAAGGTRIDAGVDTDSDGVLDDDEITSTSYVCNAEGSAPPAVASFDDEVCDPTAIPNVNNGIFVDVIAGDDITGSGTPQSPVQSLAPGVSLALAAGRTSLYLAQGTHDSDLDLPAGSVLYVEGSWVPGETWHRNCETTAREQTTIGAVQAQGVMGGIRSLTARVAGGFSNIAVRALAGTFFVRDAIVEAGSAGNGTPGANGPMGASTGSFAACSSGAFGLPAPDAPASSGGIFLGDLSYSPGSGLVGAPGQVGFAGVQGPASLCQVGQCYPNSHPYSCNPYSCNCNFFGGCSTCWNTCYSYTCDYYPSNSFPIYGMCGAGGFGGMPGQSGGGGGASVALAVANGASVSVTASSLVSGNGGDGATGGVGGGGGQGAFGAPNQSSCDTTGCSGGGNVASCSDQMSLVFAGPGGKGGSGGKGANGGSGAGGPSYAVLKQGSAIFNVSADTSLTAGTGGLGGPGAASGASAAVGAL
jgi:hypothetical protein